MDKVTVVGAGLAGVETAYYLARRNIPVRLVDCKPSRFTPAHSSPDFGELVCSNSLILCFPDKSRFMCVKL